MNSHEHPFTVGQIYRRRRDIHGRFSGQSQGGVSTPSAAPLVFLFTGESGAGYGYEDSFRPDGTFWYTGEGQVGDMQMVRGNAAIANHHDQRKRLLLYEYLAKDAVRFLGEVECLGQHTEQRPDRNGDLRSAIIFHLGFLAPLPLNQVEQLKGTYTPGAALPTKLTLAELRGIALESISPDAPIGAKRINVARRAEAIRRYALARAQGSCESCKAAAPFKSKAGPFLEVHHVFRLADGGPRSSCGCRRAVPQLSSSRAPLSRRRKIQRKPHSVVGEP